MRIAVLMTCHNRVETTLRCLAALRAQRGVEDVGFGLGGAAAEGGSRYGGGAAEGKAERSDAAEGRSRYGDVALPGADRGTGMDVFLVDDGSTDGTGEKVREWADRNVGSVFDLHLIAGNGKLFWCKGMRLAWDTAERYARERGFDYDFYLWLNDDVTLAADAVEGLLADFAEVSRKEPKSVLYGTFAASEGAEELTYGCGLTKGSSVPVCPNGRPQRVFGETTGNLVLVPRAVYEEVGKIYGGFSHGVADTDYGLMLDEHGCAKYVGSRLSGWCRANKAASGRELREMGLFRRIRLLWDPRGRNVHDTFVLRYRHWGLWRAIVSSAHVIITVVLGRGLRRS